MGALGPAQDNEFLLRFDGGARGNPGAAGAGSVLYPVVVDGGAAPRGGASASSSALGPPLVVARHSHFAPHATNNEAEYLAAILGLQLAHHLGVRRLCVEGDSTLVVKHFSGEFRCDKEHLRPLLAELRTLAARFSSFRLRFIPRERNADADRAANEAMDRRESFTRGEYEMAVRCASFRPRLPPLQWCRVEGARYVLSR